MTTYSYDGLLRLMGICERIANTTPKYTYTYDLAGNRTDVWQSGTQLEHRAYNTANQVNGWIYDDVGNLKNDGTAAYSYDALSRMTARSSTTRGDQSPR